jgi:hypothetical protein
MGPNSSEEALHELGYRRVPLDQTYSEFLQCAAQRKGREPRIFDTAAIERILKKIDPKHWKSPLDREALAQDLELACSHFKIWEACDRAPSKNQLIGQLKGFLKVIVRLRKNLSSRDGVGANGLARALCNTDPQFDAWYAVIANVSVLEEAAEQALARFNEGSPPIAEPSIDLQQKLVAETKDPNNARIWLIGRKLPEIHERYFKSRPYGVSRRSGGGDPEGPAIDFVQEVLCIAQILSSKGTPYRPASIADVFRTCRPKT